jgi:hypothetical protein
VGLVKFAVDFDGTFSADPPLFRRLCATIRNAGHEVRIVTARANDCRDDIEAIAGPWVDGIICTDGNPKRVTAAKLGYVPHIWIDDCPESIAMPYLVEGE